MASSVARSARNHEVRRRLGAAFAAIAQRLGVEVPPEPKRMKDPELQPIVELERFAAFAESVRDTVAERDAAHEESLAERDARIAELEKALEEATKPPPVYKDMKVDDLKALMTERQIEIPDGAKKDDLIAALEAADAKDDDQS